MLLQFWGCQANIVTLRSSCMVAWGRARWKPYTSQECLASTDFAPVVSRPPQTQALIAAAASFLAASRSLIGQPWPTHDKPIPIVAGILQGVTAASEA